MENAGPSAAEAWLKRQELSVWHINDSQFSLEKSTFVKPEHQPDNGTAPENQKKSETGEILKDVGKDLLRETGTTLKWAASGALIGAVILGALGFWRFGVTGLAVGTVAGAVLGWAAGFWAYFSA